MNPPGVPPTLMLPMGLDGEDDQSPVRYRLHRAEWGVADTGPTHATMTEVLNHLSLDGWQVFAIIARAIVAYRYLPVPEETSP